MWEFSKWERIWEGKGEEKIIEPKDEELGKEVGEKEEDKKSYEEGKGLEREDKSQKEWEYMSLSKNWV